MVPESLSLKTFGTIGGVLAGLTVLVRLGRLLEAIDTLRVEVQALRVTVADLQQAVARLEGQAQ